MHRLHWVQKIPDFLLYSFYVSNVSVFCLCDKEDVCVFCYLCKLQHCNLPKTVLKSLISIHHIDFIFTLVYFFSFLYYVLIVCPWRFDQVGKVPHKFCLYVCKDLGQMSQMAQVQTWKNTADLSTFWYEAVLNLWVYNLSWDSFSL